jgi:hypothetical protein
VEAGAQPQVRGDAKSVRLFGYGGRGQVHPHPPSTAQPPLWTQTPSAGRPRAPAAHRDLRPARRPAPPSEASDSSESSEEAEEGPETEEQQAEQDSAATARRCSSLLGQDLNVDQPGQPPAWVFWHPQLFLAEQVADVEAELAETVAHFQNLWS